MEPSTFTIFARRITGKGWSKRMIRRKFLKEVEKGDYAKSEAGQILNFLFSLGKKVEI